LSRRVLLAGVQSGCGKTSVTVALLQLLKQKNISVIPFKAGPDFLDPLWHKAITGVESKNLDSYMVGEEESLRLINNVNNSEFILVEGVMGLFDGRSGVGERGSSLHLAVELNLEIWLVIDAKGMSGSIVPLLSGFVEFAKAKGGKISGVIANRVGSAHHAKLLQSALAEYELPPLIGWLEKNIQSLPERHLGLVRPQEQNIPELSKSLHIVDDTFIATKSTILSATISSNNNNQPANKKTDKLLQERLIAVAKDEACCFIYSENIRWLESEGATIKFFSPVAGEEVPFDADGVWLPGGYPELYAEQLASSKSLGSIRAFIESGGALLAECGGMMLLGESLTDHAGVEWQMAGALPIKTEMKQSLVSLGYRDEEVGARGHEFHHSMLSSTLEDGDSIEPAFSLSRGHKGVHYRGVRASYIHWYFPSSPTQIAGWFT